MRLPRQRTPTRPNEISFLKGSGHLIPIGIHQGRSESHEELVEVVRNLTLLIGIGLRIRCFGGRGESLRDRDGFGAASDERDRGQGREKSGGEAHPMDPMGCSGGVQDRRSRRCR